MQDHEIPFIEEALLLTPHLNKVHTHSPSYPRWWKKNTDQATSLFVSWHGTYVRMPFPLSRTNCRWVGALQVTTFSTSHRHIIIVIIHYICVVLLSSSSQAYSP
jgi:hypothetical protein